MLTTPSIIQITRLNPVTLHHMESVLQIIQATSNVQTNMQELRVMLWDHTGLIAQDINTGDVLGLLLYSSYPLGREIQIVAVRPEHQRRGIGKALVERMRAIMDESPNIREITAQVLETQLPVHLFLRACQFRAVEILDENKYLFVCRKQEVPETVKRECVGV